jgi:TetR/AcrR family transcriptional regulator, regulator of autoinduction and epiphytic fitness
MPKTPTRSERKRSAIINAARYEFQARGYDATSMDQIAARAEVSKRTVYNHFPSKANLFRGIISSLWQSTRDATDLPFVADMPVADQLSEIAHRKIALLLEAEYIGLIRAVVAECIRSQELAHQVFSVMRDEEEGLVTWISTAVDHGRLVVDDPETAADQFWALTKGRVFWAQVLGAEAPDMQTIRTIIAGAVTMFLDHYSVQQPS